MSDEWVWPEGSLPRRNGVPVENQQEVLDALNASTTLEADLAESTRKVLLDAVTITSLKADLAEALELLERALPYVGAFVQWRDKYDALLKRRGEG